MESVVRFTGPLWGDYTGHQSITLTKGCSICVVSLIASSEQVVEQLVELSVIWDAVTFI